MNLGEEVDLTVNAYKITANPNIRDIDPASRGCRFPDEIEGLEILKVYSKAGCQFECMLKEAVERCGCTPWNFPVVPGKLCNGRCVSYSIGIYVL